MLFHHTLFLLIGLLVGVAFTAPHSLINPDAVAVAADGQPISNTPDDDLVKRGGGKRGIAFNSADVVSQFQSPKVSWAYNWATNPNGAVPGVEYVPTLWGAKMFDYWKNDANKALSTGCGHLLGFNEPDHPEQANMSPQAAAAAYKQHITPFKGRASLGSPACTSSEEAGMGLDWMRQFFAACGGGCGIDFMATHWYGGADQVDFFKQHVNAAIALAKSNGMNKVWVTEFGSFGSDAQQSNFLSQVLPWLDNKPEVARYAYFFASDGYMMTGKTVNSVGQQYINA